MTEFWEAKYKALRAAFVAWRRIERQNKKARIKQMQRYQNLVFTILDVTDPKQPAEKLWEMLKADLAAELDD
jgi:hypothetical protein